MEDRKGKATEDPADRLRTEVRELHASRTRLVVAADAERRRIERDLHDGLQQQLVGLAVKLQLARRLADDDVAAAGALLDELGDDVREALEETRKLAHGIYPPLLEAGGLGPALRAAAASLGTHARIDVTAGAIWPAAVAGTAYFCCVAALERIAPEATATVTVREEDGAVVFEIVGPAVDAPDLTAVRDRVEALGGRLTVMSERISASLPIRR